MAGRADRQLFTEQSVLREQAVKKKFIQTPQQKRNEKLVETICYHNIICHINFMIQV